MPGNVSFLEIGTKDAAASRAFFQAVFDWPFNPTSDPGPGWFQTPSIRAGLHGNDPEPRIYVFFDVKNLADAILRVKAAGGEASQPGPEEPGFGRFSFCKDPQGVQFGLHQVPALSAPTPSPT